jgi:hypothetical protein
MATSFPYLAVAKQYGVDYWRVLQFAELIDRWPPKPEDWALDMWKVATCMAWKTEHDRRQSSAPLIQWSAISDPTSWDLPKDMGNIIVTVRGDCGVVHENVVQWQNCATCASILKSRLAR